MADVEVLLKRLREIKFGEEYLKVFIAYDRKNQCDIEAEGNIVNGERKNRDKNDGFRNQKGKTKYKEKDVDRTVEVEYGEVNTTLFNRNEVNDDVGLELRSNDDVCPKMEEYEESRFSGMSRVCETLRVEITKKEEKSAKSAVDVDKTPREEACGKKENKEKGITCEKKLDNQDRDCSNDKSRNIVSQMEGVGNNGEMGQFNEVGPMLSKAYIPDQMEMNMNGPKERNGHVGVSGAMDESSNVKIRRTRRGKDDMNNKKYLDEIFIAKTSVRGRKRGVHPTSSNNSGYDRLNKKRKENGNEEGDGVSNTIKSTSGIKDLDFEEANKNDVFNGAGDLGTNKRGMSAVYKAYHDEGDGKKETFVFRSTGRADSGIKGCSINMDQVKEISELIGVSWAEAKNVKERDFETKAVKIEILPRIVFGFKRSGNRGRQGGPSVRLSTHLSFGILFIMKIISINIRGLGKSEKKGWIKSIIREERPYFIGLQETKCGMLDDPLIEERFVSVKGEWKGRDGDVAWCIFSSLNVVRSGDERMNSQVNSKETIEFNDIISDANLELCNLWGNLSVVALDRKLSDPCPIVLKDIDLDFGRKPFRAFDIWLEEKDIGHVIEVFRKEAMTWELEAENGALSEIEREPWMKARKSNIKSNIRGLMVNGLWCEDPKLIKAEMARHYKALFSEGTCCDHVGKISVDDALVVEKEFTEGDIWDAEDMIGVIKWFGESMKISKGCNSSFVTIIPKVTDPIGLVDFRPIGLIGFYYKIIVKVLAERIKRVVGKKSDNSTVFSDEVEDDEDYRHDGHDSSSSGVMQR
ncbi:RNA-directed DNA polymerase, eukaryota [Tanacetum coccineum]